MRYDYKCTKCKDQFVREFPIATNPKTQSCPVCLGLSVRDYTVGMPQVQLIGWGWNTTDKLDPMDPENNNPFPVPPVPARPYISRKKNRTRPKGAVVR